MSRIREKYLIAFAIASSVLAVACSKKPELSQEQAAHKKSIDYCFSLMVEAGAKWHQGDQVGNLCERQNPTRPQLARMELMELLGKKGLAPENLFYPSSLPDGDCKILAERFIALQEQAYGQDGEAKSKALSEAAAMLANVEAGSCSSKAPTLP